jgi:two-component system, OmpR family, alkaline phosphatase synthesis response regulator PhoP
VTIKKGHILIVEDDEAIATGVAMNLRLEGYDATVIADGLEAARRIHDDPPALVLLDLALPHKSGLELLRELRDQGDTTPIIVLSARVGEYDKVAALRLGADDYVTKPFALAELMARVDAVLRRTAGEGRQAGGRTYEFGAVRVEMSTRTVLRDHEEIKLTHREFELLSFLVRHPARVFSRPELLREVWGLSSGSARTVDNFVAQLRGKIELDPENPRHVITVRGSGYRFDL